MAPEELAELVIQIDTKLDNLIAAFDKVSNGVGFPRCAERAETLKILKQETEALKATQVKPETITAISERTAKLENQNIWLWRTVGALVLGLIVKSVWGM